VLNPECSRSVEDVIKDGHGDENMSGGSTLQIQLLALLVSRGIHCRWQVDHPGENGLYEGVVQQIDGETDATEEVEDRGGEDLAGPGGKEDAQEHSGGTEMIPVAAHVGLVGGHAMHRPLHDMRPVCVLRAVLRVSSEEHANDDHHGGDRGGEDRGGRVSVVVVQLSNEHAGDDVEALEGANGETCARLDDMSGWLCRMLTLAHLPKVQVEHGVDQQAGLGLDQDGGKHGGVDQHAALQEQVQGPLGAVVLVPANGPRLRLDLDQRLEGVPEGRLLAVPALADPGRVHVLGHVVCVGVGHEPCDKGGGHGGQDQAAGACQGGARNACEGSIVVAGARLADGTDRVDVAGDEEEDGDGAAAADGEAEEGQLEQVRRRRGVVGGRVQPGHEGGAQMAGHDHEGRNAAQAIDPVGVAGRHGARCQSQVPGASPRCEVRGARCEVRAASERR
jgi:hypothetical protein